MLGLLVGGSVRKAASVGERSGLLVPVLLLLVLSALAQPLRPLGQLDTLSNGLKIASYNDGAQSVRLAFALALRVGAANELLPQEEGAAHFLEHLLCDDPSTLATLTALGNRYGAEFNAYTGYDRTVYLFSLPASLDSATTVIGRIVGRWLGGMHFDTARISQQRRVILREIADFVPPDWLMEAKLSAQPHLDHLPIGRAERVADIAPTQLVHFYRKHYVPANATLIVLGDCPRGFLDSLRSILSQLPAGSAQAPLPDYDLFERPVPICQQLLDTAASQLHFELSWPYSCPPQYTKRQWLENCLRRAAVQVLNEQLRLQGCKATLSAEHYLFSSGFLGLDGSASTPSELYATLRQALEILTAFAAHTPSAPLQTALASKATLNLSDPVGNDALEALIEEAVNSPRGGSSHNEVAWAHQQIEALNAHHWQGVLQAVVPTGCPVVAGYQGHTLVDSALANQAIRLGQRRGAEACEAPPFLTTSPTPTTTLQPVPHWLGRALATGLQPTSTTLLPSIGCYTFQLANALPVVYKKIADPDSMLYMELLWPGGYSMMDSTPRAVQETLAACLEYLHLGPMASDSLTNLLYQQGLSWLPIVEASQHRLMLSCPANKVTELLNLVRALLTQAHYDSLTIDHVRHDMLADLPFAEQAPVFAIDHCLLKVIDPDFSPVSPGRKAWEQVTAKAVQRFYNELFCPRQGLQIVAVGSLHVDTLAAAINAAIGPLSLCGQRTTRVAPIGASTTMPDTTEKQTSSSFAYYRVGYPLQYGLRGALVGKLMQNLLLQQANDDLRNARGLVYSPYVTAVGPTQPGAPALLALRGACQAKNLHDALASAKDCFLQLALRPVDPAKLSQLQRAFLLNRADALGPQAGPLAWRDYLAEQLIEGISPVELEHYQSLLLGITPEMIQKAFLLLVSKGREGSLTQ